MLVFVYGTLKKNYRNHIVMQHAKGTYVGSSAISGFGCVNTPWFPYAVIQADKKIIGEVYEVLEEGITVLDQLEGYPNLYGRTLVDTEYGKAWIYYSQSDVSEYISQYGWTEEWKR